MQPFHCKSCRFGVVVNVTLRQLVGVNEMPKKGVVDCTCLGNIIPCRCGVVSVHVARSDWLCGDVCKVGGAWCDSYNASSLCCFLQLGWFEKKSVHIKMPFVSSFEASAEWGEVAYGVGRLRPHLYCVEERASGKGRRRLVPKSLPEGASGRTSMEGWDHQ